MADLYSALAKLNRAKVHIREAKNIFETIINGNLYGSNTERDRNGWYCYKITAINQPPPQLALAIGDAAHCLRSSLDHLAYAFTKKMPGKENRSAQFPICSSPEKFREQRRRRLLEVNRSARALMERFQPYHRRKHPEAKWLAALREIDDMDKHRLLPFTEVKVKRVTLGESGGQPIKRFKGYTGRMKVGAILARFQPQDPRMDGKVKVNVVVIPIFGKGAPKEIEGETAINAIIAARNFIINEVMPAFMAIK